MTSKPKTLQECYDRSICTFAFTGKNHTQQVWYRTPEWPSGEGFCLVCANAHYGDRTGEWIGASSTFFCDLGAQGRSDRLPKFDNDNATVPSVPSSPSGPSVPSSSLQNPTNAENEYQVTSDLDYEPSNYPTKATSILEGLSNQGQAVIVTEDLTKQEERVGSNTIYHSNFVNYLQNCWATHAGMVIRPSDIWFVVAGQLAKHINDPVNAETYRRHFSDAKPGAAKEKLIFVVPNPDFLNIDMIMDRLKQKVKIDVALFCPEFSDSTKTNKEAIAACFCEAMEAYYEYCTSKCGISKVRVCGTQEDWYKIASTARALGEILTNAKTYLQGVAELATEIWDKRSQAQTWLNFFKIQDCGSGHSTVVVGSVTKLYCLMTKLQDFNGQSRSGSSYPSGPLMGADLSKFEDGSQVTYTNIDTIPNKKFKKTYGIMSSTLGPDGFLTPNFNYVLLLLVSDEDRVLSIYNETEVQVLKRIKLLPLETRKDMFNVFDLLKRKGYKEADLTKTYLTN